MIKLQDLAQAPNLLAQDYQHAAVDSRIMLTGHIHQAIPDVAEAGYQEHWDCLNKYGEERFDVVFDKAARVRRGFAGLVDSRPEHIALASSVHELFVSFISALTLKPGCRIITTDSEPPSINRHLMRLLEEGVDVVMVPGLPAATVVERVGSMINSDTVAVCISSVNFETGHQALELDTLLPQCQKVGAELFVDAYQSVNVLSFSVQDYNLEQAFVVGGGSKYCQLGNGNCFMHVPPGREFRPKITGWYGHFDPVIDNPAARPIAYADGAARFDGSTYDAMPHFRAAHVFDYFERRGLTPEFLHDVNHHQLNLIVSQFRSFDFDPGIIELTADVEYMGGFVSFDSPYASRLSEKIRDRGVHTDYRKHWLRLGPAPYLSDEQIMDGVHALEEAVNELISEQ